MFFFSGKVPGPTETPPALPLPVPLTSGPLVRRSVWDAPPDARDGRRQRPGRGGTDQRPLRAGSPSPALGAAQWAAGRGSRSPAQGWLGERWQRRGVCFGTKGAKGTRGGVGAVRMGFVPTTCAGVFGGGSSASGLIFFRGICESIRPPPAPFLVIASARPKKTNPLCLQVSRSGAGCLWRAPTLSPSHPQGSGACPAAPSSRSPSSRKRRESKAAAMGCLDPTQPINVYDHIKARELPPTMNFGLKGPQHPSIFFHWMPVPVQLERRMRCNSRFDAAGELLPPPKLLCWCLSKPSPLQSPPCAGSCYPSLILADLSGDGGGMYTIPDLQRHLNDK